MENRNIHDCLIVVGKKLKTLKFIAEPSSTIERRSILIYYRGSLQDYEQLKAFKIIEARCRTV